MARQLVVELIGDSKRFSKSLDDAGGKVGGLGGKLNGLKSAALPVVGAVAAVGAGLFALGQMAAEDEAAQVRLATALRNTVGASDAVVASVEGQIEKFQKVSTFTDDQLRPAFQNLVTATKDVDAANLLMGTAMDIAAAKGLPLETVSLALAKAHDGNVGALSRLGIQTKDAEGKTLDFESVMRNANDVFGGQASAAADTTAGKMQILKRDLGELGEKIGVAVLPVMAALGTFLVEKVIPAVEDLWSNSKDLRETVADVFEVIWRAVQKAWDIVGPILKSWFEIQDKIIGGVGKVLEFGGKIGGAVGGVLGKIPGLASGGSFDGAAVVGERGPELLVGSGTVISNGGMGGMVVNINVAGSVTSERRLVDAIHEGLLSKQRRSGALGIA